jgi:hypothetical protein
LRKKVLKYKLVILYSLSGETLPADGPAAEVPLFPRSAVARNLTGEIREALPEEEEQEREEEREKEEPEGEDEPAPEAPPFPPASAGQAREGEGDV